MNDETFFKDLEKLIEQETAIELRPEDITISRLSAQTKWNRRRVVNVINEWVKNEKIEPIGRRREPVRGMMVDAWRIKEPRKEQ